MKYVVYKGRICSYIGDTVPSWMTLLTDAQVEFYLVNPGATVREVLDMKLAKVDMGSLKREAMSRLDAMANARLIELMPDSRLQIASAVKLLGTDGQITIQVAEDRLRYYANMSKALNDYKMELYLAINGCTDKAGIDAVMAGVDMSNVKVG